MNISDIIQQSIVACISDYDYRTQYAWSTEHVNVFLEKHEGILISTGCFVQGLRAKSEIGGYIPYRERIDGILGIIDMNIMLLRKKLAQIQQMQNQNP